MFYNMSFSLKNQKYIFSSCLKGYKYFEKRCREKIELLEIEYTENSIQESAKRNYTHYLINAILLVVLDILFVICIYMLISMSLIFLFEHVEKAISYMKKYLSNGVTKDGWLDFFGNILGSVVTMLGIIITLRFESKKDKVSRQKQSQPIIMLQHRKNEGEQANNEYKSSYNLSFCLVSSKCADYDKLKLVLPDIILRNIGLNAAIDIEINFYIDGLRYQNGMGLDYLPPNEFEAIKVEVELFKQNINKIFKYNTEACFDDVFENICKDNKKRIVSHRYKAGKLSLSYFDIFGNKYCHYFVLTLHFIILDDASYISYITYPPYSKDIKYVKRLEDDYYDFSD